MFVIAHDLGSSGNKATLVDTKGKILANSFKGYKTFYPKLGWTEQEPRDWWEAVLITTKDLVKKAKIYSNDIGCISFSGQIMSCIPVD